MSRLMVSMVPMVPFVLAGCMSFNNLEIPLGAKHAAYTQRVVESDPEPEGKVALVDLQGVLENESEESLFGSKESQLVSFIEKLKIAEADPHVRAVILRIDSPGGDVTTSDILLNELRAFKRRKGVPVVAVFMGVSASGGYYVASGCDRIVAHPTTITGSIGVIALHVSLAGLLEKIGVKVEALKSGARKDTGSVFRDLTPEDRKVLQAMIDATHRRFVSVVAEGRKSRLGRREVEALADGRIFTADQALEAGLVDRVGYLGDALDETRKLSGLSRVQLVMYSRKPQKLENPYSAPARKKGVLSSDLDQVRRILGFRLYYLWDPYVLGR